MPHEIFISHSSQDKKIAEAIRTALEDSSIPCWISHRDIPPGVLWFDACAEALHESAMFVLVLTSSATESSAVIRELDLAIWQKLELIPFKVENVELRRGINLLLRTSQWLDASSPPVESHVEELVRCVKERLRTARATRSQASTEGVRGGTNPSVLCNVPEDNPLFTGREQVLEQLCQQLSRRRRVAIVGLPGIGKTQTAIKYAHQNQQLYSHILWANASTRDALFKDFSIIAQHVGLPERNEQDQNIVTASLKHWLTRSSLINTRASISAWHEAKS